jgi:hypothetical protein
LRHKYRFSNHSVGLVKFYLQSLESMMKSKQQIFNEIYRSYVSAELEEKAKTDREARVKLEQLQVLAIVDTSIIWDLQQRAQERRQKDVYLLNKAKQAQQGSD